MTDADFLIIGGGTAGAVLASRLSEDPGTRVLLIEAGSDTPPEATPADVADTFPSSSLNPGYFWPGLQATRAAGEGPRPFPQARIMGGGSNVMGLWALRGMPADFDAWSAAGATGWSWSDVLPFFRRIENDSARPQGNGNPPPVPIQRVPRSDWPAFVGAIERAAGERGLPSIGDINEEPGEGFFPLPLFQDDHARSSSARCYLTAEVRRRPNLSILTQTRVTALNLTGNRVDSVIVENSGAPRRISAREVILSAGAIHSPAMLLRSGIGPARELKALGINATADRPGVGRNLQNHLYLHFALTIPPGMRLAAHLRRFAFAGIRLSSGLENCPAADLLVFAIGRVSPRSFGADLGMLGAALYSPLSRGQVSLESPEFGTPPRIQFRMLEDPRDPPRLLKAARFAESMLRDPAVAATYGDAFLLPPVMALNQFNRPGAAGEIVGLAAKAVLNAPSALRRAIINPLIRPGHWFANRDKRTDLRDDELLNAAAPMAHPAGTCAIGRADDPMAVVDAECRVYGVSNLRVVDASIMPKLPSANTNLPTLMVAERAADLIRKGSS
jgi:5-(hydroxymethyl)furfural/furfural oxidase